MKSRSLLVMLISLGVVLAVFVVPARAQEDEAAVEEVVEVEEEDIDVAELEPDIQVTFFSGGIDLALSWHSNPYYRDDTRESQAFVLSGDPDIKIDWPLSEFTYVGLSAKVNVTHVVFESGSAEEDKTVLQPYVVGRLRYNLSEHTSLSFDDNFQTANVDDVGDNPRFYLNQARLEAAHQFSERFSSRCWYRNTWLDQTESEAVLFNSMEHALGLGADYALSQTESGRPITLSVDLQAGLKEFDDGDFFNPDGGSTKDNPKTHDFLSASAGLSYPFSTLMTLYARGGLRHREYDTVSGGRDDTSDTPYAGLTLSVVPSPGSPLSFALATSYQVSDTVVYDIPDYNQSVFETTDALYNNLEVDYRELELLRVGVTADYNMTDAIRLGLGVTYQQSTADAEEDLGPVSGNLDPAETGIGDPIEKDQVVISATAKYRATSNLRVGLGYQHGFATDSELVGDEDMYTFDSFALLANYSF